MRVRAEGGSAKLINLRYSFGNVIE